MQNIPAHLTFLPGDSHILYNTPYRPVGFQHFYKAVIQQGPIQACVAPVARGSRDPREESHVGKNP
jgi:hypothetical protein